MGGSSCFELDYRKDIMLHLYLCSKKTDGCAECTRCKVNEKVVRPGCVRSVKMVFRWRMEDMWSGG